MKNNAPYSPNFFSNNSPGARLVTGGTNFSSKMSAANFSEQMSESGDQNFNIGGNQHDLSLGISSVHSNYISEDSSVKSFGSSKKKKFFQPVKSNQKSKFFQM